MNRSFVPAVALLGIFSCLAEGGDWGKSPKAVTYEETSLLKGDFEVTLGNTWLRPGPGTLQDSAPDFFSGAGELQLGMDFGSHYFAQIDILGEFTDAGNYEESYDSGYLFAGHLMRRNSDRGGLGIFGGAFETDQDNDGTSTTERYFVGLEGQLYRSNATLFGQVGYLDGDGGSDDGGLSSVRDALFGRAGIQYFLNEDLMLEAEVSAASGHMDVNVDDCNLYGWGVKAEKRFTNMLTGAVGYQGARYVQNGIDDERVLEHTAYVSFTVLFDQDTLQARSRNSTSLDTPQFLRWSAETGGVLE